jgi:hypothetical protein
MSPQRSITTFPAESIFSAWREGIAEIAKNSRLEQQLWQREGELLPRFADCYTEHTALPRRMRRGVLRQFRRTRGSHHLTV